MAMHAAFLRGVNLGKSRRIGGEQLRAVFEGLGFEGVASFRASGNVVFEAAEREDGDRIEARIEAGLADSLGFEVSIFLRSAGQVRAIAAHRPFPPAEIEPTAGKLQVALLPETPGRSARDQALALGTGEDRLAIRGRELYWLPSGGISDSPLDLKALEAGLGPWTMRTKGTIEQLAAKHLSG
jgi:uncharacterized protein (DUF1697 family)